MSLIPASDRDRDIEFGIWIFKWIIKWMPDKPCISIRVNVKNIWAYNINEVLENSTSRQNFAFEPSDAFIRQLHGPPFVKTMAFCLSGTKPSCAPICQLDPENKPQWTLKQNMIIFMRETENAISKTASFLVSASNRCNANDIIQIKIMSSRSGLKGPDCFEISKRYSIFTSLGSEFHKMHTLVRKKNIDCHRF